MADATIAIWNAKNTYNTWRPITAIADASADGNPATSMTGVVRTFTSFPAAVEQVEDARVWGGIHFRFSSQNGARTGAEVAQYLTRTHLLPIHTRPTQHSPLADQDPETWRTPGCSPACAGRRPGAPGVKLRQLERSMALRGLQQLAARSTGRVK